MEYSFRVDVVCAHHPIVVLYGILDGIFVKMQTLIIIFLLGCCCSISCQVVRTDTAESIMIGFGIHPPSSSSSSECVDAPPRIVVLLLYRWNAALSDLEATAPRNDVLRTICQVAAAIVSGHDSGKCTCGSIVPIASFGGVGIAAGANAIPSRHRGIPGVASSRY